MINKLTTDLNHIQALDDEPNDVTGLTPTQLKAVFDQAPNDIKTYINSLVDILNSTTDGSSGADNISATSINGLSGTTVQTLLESLKTLSDDNKTYLLSQIGNVVLGQIPDNSLTETKMANDMKKDVVGGVTSYNAFTSHLADNLQQLADKLFLDIRGCRYNG